MTRTPRLIARRAAVTENCLMVSLDSPARLDLLPVLALSASADGISVALGSLDDAGVSLECWSEPPLQSSSDRLLGLVGSLLASRGVKPEDLRLLVVDTGPGPFTALRSALATAQGVAIATGVPATGVSSTEALAFHAARHCGVGRHDVLVAIDARMNEAYAAAVEVVLGEGGELESLTEVRPCVVCPVDEVWSQAGLTPSNRQGAPVVLAGNGATRCVGLLPALKAAAQASGWTVVPSEFATAVRADALAEFGLWRASRVGVDTEKGIAPRYVRNKVALDIHEQARARELVKGTK